LKGIEWLILWYAVVQCLGLITAPIMFRACKNLLDRGYTLTKITGILLLTYFTYAINVTTSIPVGASIWLSMLLMLCLSALALIHKKFHQDMRRQFGDKGLMRTVLLTEASFALILFALSAVRSYTPDINTGESVYDLSYINAFARAEQLPPPHPWFAGITVDNYYCYGHMIFAVLSRLTGTETSIGYNIGLALVPALAFIGLLGIVYNLTKSRFYGVLAAVLVVFGGNIMTLLQVANYFLPDLDLHVKFYAPPDSALSITQKLAQYNWWWPSRIIPWAIHEPVYWSFIWADLHGHFIAIPLRVLAIGLILNLFMSNKTGMRSLGGGIVSQGMNAFLVSMSIGYLAVSNVYDYPIILSLLGFTMAVHLVTRSKALAFSDVFSALALITLVAGLSFFLFLHVDSQVLQGTKLAIFKELPHEEHPLLHSKPDSSVRVEVFKTSLYHFLLVFSLQILTLSTFLVCAALKALKRHRTMLRLFLICLTVYIVQMAYIFSDYFDRVEAFYSMEGQKLALDWNYMLFDFQLLPLLAPLLIAFTALSLNRRSPSPADSFAFIQAVFGGLVVLFAELVNIEGRYLSLNKFYGHVYIFWGIATIYLLHRILKDGLLAHLMKAKALAYAWIALFIILFSAYLLFPVLSSYQKTNGLVPFDARNETSLDGLDWVRIHHPRDYEAIKWLNENVAGSPRILEVPGRPYRYTSRISAFTGLPTIIGWDFHMELQLGIPHEPIVNMSRDADEIYNTTSIDEALYLLRKYDVRLVYVGELEKDYNSARIEYGGRIEKKEYSAEGLRKFEDTGYFEKIYDKNDVQIYVVRA
jgi:YYY domain-containing protein